MKTTQQSRRQNPYPWTWELPVAAVIAFLFALVLGVHLGRTLANGFAGGWWHLTDRSALFSSLLPILGGDATAGLSSPLAHHASGHTLAVWIALVELAIVVVSVWLLVLVMRRWGPQRLRGMATPAEAEELLGLSRLRRNAHIIRPDLHTRRSLR